MQFSRITRRSVPYFSLSWSSLRRASFFPRACGPNRFARPVEFFAALDRGGAEVFLYRDMHRRLSSVRTTRRLQAEFRGISQFPLGFSLFRSALLRIPARFPCNPGGAPVGFPRLLFQQASCRKLLYAFFLPVVSGIPFLV